MGATALLGALALLIAATAPKPLTPEQIVKKWADGPVRYLMSYEEESKLLELKTPDEYARFITEFWRRRDPSPGTFENEYRRMFWARVSEANRRFRSSTTPGWKTDRGKIFILLGEPDDTETNMSNRGGERWTYKRQFSKKADPEFYVVFTQRADEWVLSSDPSAASPFYDFSGLALDPGAVGTPAIQSLIASAQTGLGVASIAANLDLGAEMQAVSSNAELVLATVNTRDFVSAFSAATKFEFFRAKDGSTFVNVCALLNASDLYAGAAKGISYQRLYASFEPMGGGTTRFATNEKAPSTYDLAKGPEPGGLVGIWSGVAVAPGRYRMTMALEDSFTGRLGRAEAEIQVPDYSGGGLSLSSPVLASALADASDRMSVVVRSSGVFRKSEEFGVYYEVYGIGTEGAAGFEASYLFYRETAQGPQPIGHALAFKDRSGASQGWSFPLAKWPAGKYRIQITVTDREGKTASAAVPFTVEE